MAAIVLLLGASALRDEIDKFARLEAWGILGDALGQLRYLGFAGTAT